MPPLLITVGEPAGIGPDIILRAYTDNPADFDNMVIAAPALWLEKRATEIGVALPIYEHSTIQQAEEDAANRAGLCCWNPVGNSPEPMIGMPLPETAEAVIHSIKAAAIACMRGEASAMITGPIEKAVLKRSGFSFPGHTEFLAHLASEHQGHNGDFVMMLAADSLKVALLTTHIAIADVPSSLSSEATLKTISIVDADMRNRFGITHPRLGLCALNPHAGEQGHFGREEIEILAPAVTMAKAEGINISDPLPADTIFSPNNRSRFDAIICCYHDQALIPIKALCFGEAVNVTLGLPFIRTSVDHGTALDLVGSSDVSSSSLLAAMSMARTMAGENDAD